jgi:thiol-disulfide isomerase/thioredoxin
MSQPQHTSRTLAAVLVVVAALLGYGSAAAAPPAPAESAAPASPAAAPTDAVGPSVSPETADATETAERPEWFDLEMTDVVTGETFTINDYAGKVVLLETMAIWCPTCQRQGDEVVRLHELLGEPEDLVSVSLDVDMGEDGELLRNYVEKLGYDWHFAVAPILVARALGNLYSAQYLNPPVSPMLVIDRDGNVLGLPFGSVKSAESLQGVVQPLLEA